MCWQGSFEQEGCPDWDASHHSTCGTFHYRGQPDDWLNEECWGLGVGFVGARGVVRWG